MLNNGYSVVEGDGGRGGKSLTPGLLKWKIKKHPNYYVQVHIFLFLTLKDFFFLYFIFYF